MTQNELNLLLIDLGIALNKYKKHKQETGTWNKVLVLPKDDTANHKLAAKGNEVNNSLRKQIDRLIAPKQIERMFYLEKNLERFTNTVIEITELFGDHLDLDATGHVQLINGAFKFKKKVYKIYFTSLNNKLITGVITIEKPVNLSSPYELFNTNIRCTADIFVRKNKIGEFKGYHTETNYFQHIELNNAGGEGTEDGHMELNLIFKRDTTNEANIFVGSVQYKKRRRLSSHLCVMTLNDDNDSLLPFIEYVLSERTTAHDVENFSYDIQNEIKSYEELPQLVKMWRDIISYKGYYRGCIIIPDKRELRFIVIKVDLNGKVAIYNNKEVSSYYEGIIRCTHDHHAKIWTISADFDPVLQDYGIRMHLNEYDIDTVFKGIYTSVVSENGRPAAWKFIMKKIKIEEDKLIEEIFSHQSISSKAANDQLKKYGFLTHFRGENIF